MIGVDSSTAYPRPAAHSAPKAGSTEPETSARMAVGHTQPDGSARQVTFKLHGSSRRQVSCGSPVLLCVTCVGLSTLEFTLTHLCLLAGALITRVNPTRKV